MPSGRGKVVLSEGLGTDAFFLVAPLHFVEDRLVHPHAGGRVEDLPETANDGFSIYYNGLYKWSLSDA